MDSAPGTVSQVRGAAQELIRVAKRRGFVLVLVGHVTKEGVIAGPRVLEHMVDTVLYFEGERGHQFRILRAVKNRFGATDEIGVFEMSDRGLVEVPNPSALFLAGRAPHDSDSTEIEPVPSNARATQRLGRVCRHGRHSPSTGRSSGSRRPGRARHASPRRRRLGRYPARDDRRCARCALRPIGRRQRHLPQRRRRAADRRAGGGSRGRSGAGFGIERERRCRPILSCSGKSRCRAMSARSAIPKRGSRRPQSSASAGAWMPALRSRRRATGNAAAGLATVPTGHLSELVTRLSPRHPPRRRGLIEAAQ